MTTLSQIGQITSSMEKQELVQLETIITNLYNYKEHIVLNPNMPTEHIDVIKAQINTETNNETFGCVHNKCTIFTDTDTERTQLFY